MPWRNYHFKAYFGFLFVFVSFENLHILQKVLKAYLPNQNFTLLSLSKSKALNSLSENYCEQCNPRIPIFFLNDSKVINYRLPETLKNLCLKICTFFLVPRLHSK